MGLLGRRHASRRTGDRPGLHCLCDHRGALRAWQRSSSTLQEVAWRRWQNCSPPFADPSHGPTCFSRWPRFPSLPPRRVRSSFSLERPCSGPIRRSWHLPADYVGLKGYGDLFWLVFLINGPLVLTAHSVIMTWLWQRTNGSTLAVVLYHWSITASAIVAPSAPGHGWQGIISAAIGVGALWLVAVLLLAIRRRDFVQPQKASDRSE